HITKSPKFLTRRVPRFAQIDCVGYGKRVIWTLLHRITWRRAREADWTSLLMKGLCNADRGFESPRLRAQCNVSGHSSTYVPRHTHLVSEQMRPVAHGLAGFAAAW